MRSPHWLYRESVGLLALTALGGVVGYRQARAGQLVRAAGTARFLQ